MMPAPRTLRSASTLSILALITACGTAEHPAAIPARHNPLDTISTLPFQAPDFSKLTDADFRPAILRGMEEHLAEVRAIVTDPEQPTFENTIVALERSGQALKRATGIFHNLTGSATNDTLQALLTEMAPRLAAHSDAIDMDPALFARVKAVHAVAGDLDAVDRRLVERYYQRFVRAGALLDEAGKARLKGINEELSTLGTRFSDNVLKEVGASAVLVEDRAQLEGLGDANIEAAAVAAREKGHPGKWAIALRNTTQQPALASLKDRTLRERILKASMTRNAKGDSLDNRSILARQAQLRAQKAQLLGFPNWASYVMDDQMARTPEAAVKLLGGMVPAAVRNAKAELARLQALVDKQGGGYQVEAWDWDFLAEQVRKAEYDLDEEAIKPYLELEGVLRNGVLYAAERLYGLTFRERKDLPVYHPDVRVFDIIDSTGTTIGLFYGDYYARDNKQGGAWMSTFVDQNTLLGQHPVVTQNCNYLKPAADQPCLLSWDDVITLFHEFGHGLHGMLSRQKYPYFSGTATATDFVEFPSQYNENWALDPAVFGNFTKHHATGDQMPADLAAKLRKSGKFNQGYATTEYLAAALLDIEWHTLSADAPLVQDVEAFERKALAKYGLDLAQVPPRYRTSYFSHIWGGGYAANYYAYMWSEVLEADAFAWTMEHGGLTRTNGDRLVNTVLSVGGSKDGNVMFRDLTGRDPLVAPLLAKRGLN